ncbi:MAG: hypothetical protein AAB787_00735 [Patescibacteria group bacterium]
MKNKEADINNLLELTDVQPRPKPGKITLTDRMEPPEENPLNDWLYIGILAMKDIAKERSVEKVACIGTGQGIDAIVASHVFRPETIYATDIVKEILEPVKKNIEGNIESQYRPKNIFYLAGKDCEPLPEKVDLIFFSPPPLMAYNHSSLNEGIVRTTIIEAEPYLNITDDSKDIRLKWSTLPQYQFLLSAKEKLNRDGLVLTLYTGRIPFEATEAAFSSAGFSIKVRYQVIKKQTDPQFLKEYATYEKEILVNDTFDFFDYYKTKKIMKSKGFDIPGIITGHSDISLKNLLKEAKISAQQAYQISSEGKEVAHIGYALEGRPNTL